MYSTVSTHPGRPAHPLAGADGFIFDMDDLLIHSKPLWQRAIRGLLSDCELPDIAAHTLRYRGLSAADTAGLIHRTFQLHMPLNAFQRLFVDRLLQEVRDRPVVPHAGAIQAVKNAARIKPVAVASGSPLAVIRSVLSRLGIEGEVNVVVSSEEVGTGKPDPDVFLEAARRLATNPHDCVVFEDSLVGVQAALAAGMRCVAVPSERTAEIKQMTPFVFDRLDALPWSDVITVGA